MQIIVTKLVMQLYKVQLKSMYNYNQTIFVAPKICICVLKCIDRLVYKTVRWLMCVYKHAYTHVHTVYMPGDMLYICDPPRQNGTLLENNGRAFYWIGYVDRADLDGNIDTSILFIVTLFPEIHLFEGRQCKIY